MAKATLRWLGQMGFLMTIGKTTLSVDYFASEWPGRRVAPPIPAGELTGIDAFLGSHDHGDHIDHDSWKIWAKSCPDAKFIFPSVHLKSVLDDGVKIGNALGTDAWDSLTIGDVKITAISAAHEFLNPDSEGRYPCLQYILEGNGVRIYHTGDTLRYEGMVPRLKEFGYFDAVILPINGRDGVRYRDNCIGNMTFQESADVAGELCPGVAIPGHWDMFASNPGDPDAFADYLDAKYEGRISCLIPRYLEPIEIG